MIPPTYVPYFATMAGVGVVLFGFVFLIMSIVPHHTFDFPASPGQQPRAASAYYALLTPLFLSLFALIPGQQMGGPVLLLAVFGLIRTFLMGRSLFVRPQSWHRDMKHGAFLFGELGLYGWELVCAFWLLRFPGNASALSILAVVFMLSYLFGIARVWEAVGVRQQSLADRFVAWRENMQKCMVHGNESPAQTDSGERGAATLENELAVWWMK